MSFGTFIHAEVCELYLLNEEVTHHLSSSLFYTISIFISIYSHYQNFYHILQSTNTPKFLNYYYSTSIQ